MTQKIPKMTPEQITSMAEYQAQGFRLIAFDENANAIMGKRSVSTRFPLALVAVGLDGSGLHYSA